MSTRPVSAGYLRGASLEVLEREALTNFRAGSEIVRRLGFAQCRRLYGSAPLASSWAGSWFEPPIVSGAQWISGDYFPWWAEQYDAHGSDASDAD